MSDSPNELVSKREYRDKLPALRTALLTVQQQLKAADFPVLIVIAGLDAAGRSETINLLNEWMDARYLQTVALDSPTRQELERPPLWRYWRVLPPRGRIGVFYGGWYRQPILDRLEKRLKRSRFQQQLADGNLFERQLVDDGALVIKLWLTITKKQLEERLRDWESDEATRWRVGKKQWNRLRDYDDLLNLWREALEKTDTPWAPWIHIDGADPLGRNLAVGNTVYEAIADRLADESSRARPATDPQPADESPMSADPDTLLDTLDLDKQLDKDTYQEKLHHYQGRLNRLGREVYDARVPVVVVFQGWDAAGKGGAIRRVTRALDARQYRVIAVSAPSDEERAHHYLWRFWRHVPYGGRFAIFDRSWYGRVLVERVEKLAAEPAWQRAYREINEFEEQLSSHGIVIAKFWLHIDLEEQLRRFRKREETSYKKYKITSDDYRNRQKWPLYEAAADEMIRRTHTAHAPWTLVEANDKRFARIKVLKTLCQHLERAVG